MSVSLLRPIPVVMLCVFHCGEATGFGVQGRLYNIGRGGLFVATTNELPPEGENVRIRVSLDHEGQPVPVEIVGRVRWPAKRAVGSRLAGFGVAIQRVADGARGQVFRRYLTRLLERHLAQPVSLRPAGPSRHSADPIYEVVR